MKEEWKDIKGYEGLYQVSNTGKVRSLDRKVYNRGSYSNFCFLKGKILKPRCSKSRGLSHGYLRVALCQKQFCIHRLVAEAFIDNPNKLPYVDHIDTNIDNNCVENLRWCTASENLSNPITKLKRIKVFYKGYPAVDVAKRNGINRDTFWSRLFHKWSLERACTEPLHTAFKKIGGNNGELNKGSSAL